MQRLQGGLVFKAHRLLYHSTLGLRVSDKEEKKVDGSGVVGSGCRVPGVEVQGVGD